jgi:hypothetical protein
MPHARPKSCPATREFESHCPTDLRETCNEKVNPSIHLILYYSVSASRPLTKRSVTPDSCTSGSSLLPDSCGTARESRRRREDHSSPKKRPLDGGKPPNVLEPTSPQLRNAETAARYLLHTERNSHRSLLQSNQCSSYPYSQKQHRGSSVPKNPSLLLPWSVDLA